MKNIIRFFVFITIAQCAPVLGAEDLVLRAMKDEMARTAKKLKMDDLAAPYYAAYQVVDTTQVVISGTFGSLTRVYNSVERSIAADVRIGDSNFDNTNYMGQEAHTYGPFTAVGPEQNDYDAVRNALWSLTDPAYKGALEKYSQKKAYKEKKNITEIYGDLSSDKPRALLESETSFPVFDTDMWKNRIRTLSAIFREYPAIQASSLEFDCRARVSRFVNTEKTVYRVNSQKCGLDINASIQAGDGMKINDSKSFYWPAVSDLPQMELLESEVRKFAGDMSGLVRSTATAPYLGPVLFEDEGAAEFFNQLLVRNISFPRVPWAENENSRKYYVFSGAFMEKLGMRVLPPFISVYDAPMERDYNGVSLMGSYAIDSEGVVPGRLDLVKGGKLQDFYMSRAPVKQRKTSNGHGRGALNEFNAGRPGNVFVVSERTAPKAELKQKLINMARELGLEYGILVRRLMSEDSLSYDDLLANPVLAYKVYVADGREELVHGSEFTSVSYRALRDIVLTSSDRYVYNYFQWGPIAYRRGYVPASIIAPSVLVQELELKLMDQKPDRKPYLPHPYFAKTSSGGLQ